MTPIGHFWWLFLTTTDYLWSLQSISNHFQPHPAISGHFQLFLAILATCDPFQPLLMTISNHYWLFLTIIKHFQPLPTTSCHFLPYFWPLSVACDPFQPLLMTPTWSGRSGASENSPKWFPIPKNLGSDTKMKSLSCREEKLQIYFLKWTLTSYSTYMLFLAIWSIWGYHKIILKDSHNKKKHGVQHPAP